MRYLIILEEAETGCSAYSPDLPVCVATGNTFEDAELEMREAVAFHIDGLSAEGLAPPTPPTTSAYVEVAAWLSFEKDATSYTALPSRMHRAFLHTRRCRLP